MASLKHKGVADHGSLDIDAIDPFAYVGPIDNGVHQNSAAPAAVLANTGSAANMVFNLPAGADDAILEDAGNGTMQLRSANGTFETTVFNSPTGSLTIN